MTSSLATQAADAPSFIAAAWGELRQRAKAVVEALPQHPQTVLVCGCGDSHHASDSLSHAFRGWSRLSALGSPALQTSRYLIPELSRDPSQTLLIGISASGETARTMEAIELGRQAGLFTLAVSANPESALARTSDLALCYSMAEYPLGPGLISYLGSLLAGYALASRLAAKPVRDAVDRAIEQVSQALRSQLQEHASAGKGMAAQLAGEQSQRLPVTFLGSGPAYGSAMFAAAKLIEAAGWPGWAQDTEEWAHLEYFGEPAELPVWLLSGGGRSLEREREIEQAAGQLGRRLTVSRWGMAFPQASWISETVSPLGLWVGPVALADTLADRIGEQPFRGFGGGRNAQEGGGASRIRSSRRIASLKEFEEFQRGN